MEVVDNWRDLGEQRLQLEVGGVADVTSPAIQQQLE